MLCIRLHGDNQAAVYRTTEVRYRISVWEQRRQIFLRKGKNGQFWVDLGRRIGMGGLSRERKGRGEARREYGRDIKLRAFEGCMKTYYSRSFLKYT